MQDNIMPQGPKPSKYQPDEIGAYKEVDNIELKAHVFFPKGTGKSDNHPGFVFFHPGGWTMGSPEWGYDLCHRYASRGIVAITFQYRLSSIGGYTPKDAISDAKSAMRWTRLNADDLGIDPDRVIAGGISAGGHLAASVAIVPGYYDPNDDLSISPVPDALALQSACLNPVLDKQFINLLQGKDKPENCSPFHHIKLGLPPMCLLHGTADEIVSFDSIKNFVEKTLEAGNRCELHPFEGTDHFFVNIPEGKKVYEPVDNFLGSLGYMK